MSLRDEIAETLYGDAWNSVRAQREVASIMPLVERAVRDAAIEAMAHGALFGSSSTGKIDAIVARVVGE